MRDFLLSPETGKRGDGTVRLWEVRTGKERRVLKGHRGTVRCLAISPDGKFLVSGGHDKSVIAWDPSTGKMLWKSNRLTGPGADRIGVATFRTG